MTALRRLHGRCAYCGARTKRAVACHAHSDLPALDPFYIAAGADTPAAFYAESTGVSTVGENGNGSLSP